MECKIKKLEKQFPEKELYEGLNFTNNIFCSDKKIFDCCDGKNFQVFQKEKNAYFHCSLQQKLNRLNKFWQNFQMTWGKSTKFPKLSKSELKVFWQWAINYKQ